MRYAYFFIKKENGKINGNVKQVDYKSSPIPFGGLEILLQLTFSYLVEWVSGKKKDFIDDFYTHDFTGILHNDESSGDSDIEIDLESVDVKEVYDEEEAACIVIDDDQVSFILKSNANKIKCK